MAKPSKANRHLGTTSATGRIGSLDMVFREIYLMGKTGTLGLPHAFASHLQVKLRICLEFACFQGKQRKSILGLEKASLIDYLMPVGKLFT